MSRSRLKPRQHQWRGVNYIEFRTNFVLSNTSPTRSLFLAPLSTDSAFDIAFDLGGDIKDFQKQM